MYLALYSCTTSDAPHACKIKHYRFTSSFASVSSMVISWLFIVSFSLECDWQFIWLEPRKGRSEFQLADSKFIAKVMLPISEFDWAPTIFTGAWSFPSAKNGAWERLCLFLMLWRFDRERYKRFKNISLLVSQIIIHWRSVKWNSRFIGMS